MPFIIKLMYSVYNMYIYSYNGKINKYKYIGRYYGARARVKKFAFTWYYIIQNIKYKYLHDVQNIDETKVCSKNEK